MTSQQPEIDAALSRCGFYRLEPGARLPSQAEVESAAQAAGYALPADFVYFSAHYGAGAFERQTYLPLPIGCPLGPDFRVDILYAIGARDDWDALSLAAETYDGRLPSGTLPIGTDPGGNLILLGAGDMAGVHAWDHEHRELAEGDVDQRFAEVRSSGVDVAELDIDEMLLLWDQLFPQRVSNPTGYSNLYHMADSFRAMCALLRCT